MSAAGCCPMSCEFADVGSHDVLHRSHARVELAEERPRGRAERGVGHPTRRHQVVEDGDPVAVGLVEAIPHHPEATPPGEVGQQGGLAITRLGDEEDQPMGDFRVEPLEETVARQRLIPQRRDLDLRLLDRKVVHVGGDHAGTGRYRGRVTARSDGDGRSRRGIGLAGSEGRGDVGSLRRYGCAGRGVNPHWCRPGRSGGRAGLDRAGGPSERHGRMVARRAHLSISCEARPQDAACGGVRGSRATLVSPRTRSRS